MKNAGNMLALVAMVAWSGCNVDPSAEDASERGNREQMRELAKADGARPCPVEWLNDGQYCDADYCSNWERTDEPDCQACLDRSCGEWCVLDALPAPPMEPSLLGYCNGWGTCQVAEPECGEPPPVCASDADCAWGTEWCENGQCTGCPANMFCGLWCPYGLAERNGCELCQCQEQDPRCAGRECGEICESMMCIPENPGPCPQAYCTPQGQCELSAERPVCEEATCMSDADCAYGAEWCENGQCTGCAADALCALWCPYGMKTRNGCAICDCLPEPDPKCLNKSCGDLCMNVMCFTTPCEQFYCDSELQCVQGRSDCAD